MKIGKQFKNKLFESPEEAAQNRTPDWAKKFRERLNASKEWKEAEQAVLKELDLIEKSLPDKLKEIREAWERNDHGRILKSCNDFKAAQSFVAKEMGLKIKDKAQSRT